MKKTSFRKRLFCFISALLIVSPGFCQTAEEYLKRGNEKADLQDYEGAISEYDKALRIDRKYAFAYFARGNAKIYLKDLSGAVEDLTKAVKINPDISGAYFLRGIANSRLWEYKQAIVDFTRYIELKPDDAAGYVYRADELLRYPNYSEAIADFSRALKIAPLDGDTYIKRGLARENTKDFIGALKDYSKAVEISPDNSYNYYFRGELKYKLMDFKGALSDCDQALKYDPENIMARWIRGKARTDLKDYQAAIEDLNIVISDTSFQYHSEFAGALYYMGLASILSGKKDDGCRFLNDAVEYSNTDAFEKIYQYCNPSVKQLNYLLVEAVKLNNLARVKELLLKGADINSSFNYGYGFMPQFCTPLQLACDSGYMDLAKFLIEKGADVNAGSSDGITPLFGCNSSEMVRLMIVKGADIRHTDNEGFTPLHFPATTDIADLLIEKGADVNAKSNYGTTPLHLAADPELASLLIEKGASVDAEDIYGSTPLLKALISENTDIARLLIEKGANVNVSDTDGITPLHRVKTIEIARLLIEKGANVNASDNYGNSPLTDAINQNQGDIARLLIEKGARAGFVPFCNAIANNLKDIVLLLIDKGADVRENEGGYNSTPLEFARSADMASLLIEKGANVNAKHLNGQTPLHKVDSVEVARVLIEKGADIYAKDDKEDTPLFEAIKSNNLEIASLLISKGADVNLIDIYGVTPVYFVQSVEAARMLIDKGADIKIKDNAGDTPLHVAVEMNKDPEIINFLIENGADVNAKNKKGKIPVWKAFNNVEIASLLIDHGADINSKDENGGTPLFWLSSIEGPEEILFAINNGAEVNARDNYNVTPLHNARSIDNARLLIENGADVNAKDIDGRTPLFYIDIANMDSLLIENGANINVVDSNGHTPFMSMLIDYPSFEAASLLLKAGHPVDFKNDKGQTALIIISSESIEKESLVYLLDNNADAAIKDRNGKTALDYAKALGKTEFVNLLSSPVFIHELQSKGQQAVIELIKKDTTGISRLDTYGSSLLHYMVSNECDTLLDFILTQYKNKPLLNILNREHQTPLLFAIDHINSRYAIRLIEAGADINKEGCFGETPLFMADYRNLNDVTASLKKKKAISKTAKYPTELSLPKSQMGDVITSWSISSDGKTLITGDNNNFIKLWDIATGKEIRTFSGHTGEVICLDFSTDGRLLISGSVDRTVRLWDVATGKELYTLSSQIFSERGKEDNVNSIGFLPDGKSFISGSGHDFSLWDIAKGEEMPVNDEFEFSNRSWDFLGFSPDRKSILSTDSHGYKLWDVETGKEQQAFDEGGKTSVSFSPDSRFFLSVSTNSTIKLWDITTGKELRTFTGHTDVVTSLSFAPDGKYFISASLDKTIRLWDIATGKEINCFADHDNLVTSLKFLSDGKSFISGYYNDNTLDLWDIKTGKVLRSFKGIGKNIFSFDISKNGETLLLGSDPEVKLVRISTGIKLQNFTGHKYFVSSVRYSPDFKSFLSGSQDSTIKLWDIATGNELRTFTGHGYRINSLKFSPDGKSFLSGSWDGTTKLWDPASGRELMSFSGHEYRVNTVAFSPDAKSFISGSLDKSIKLWDVPSGKELKTFTGHDGDVWGLDFSPDGRSIYSGSEDTYIIQWDLASGKILRPLYGHTGTVISLCFSPDGKTLLSGSGDKTIKLWEISTGMPLKTFTGHTGNVVEARFHPSGKYLISCSDDKTLKYWNIDGAKEIASLVFIDSTDWIIYTPDKYYANTKNGAKFLGWVKGTQIWNFDQWDLQYNRPDIVFSRMPDPDTAMIKLYYKAYQKRLKKMKFSESMFKSDFHTPEIQIKKQTLTAQNLLELDIAAVDTLYSMDRINVWVNDVPVYGINGISLRNEKQSVGVPVKKQISLTLGEGDNKIEISVLNSAGAESLKQTAYAKNENLSVKKDLYFIAISCADYKDNRYNLKYSVKDGRDMARQFAGSGGSFANIFIDTLFNNNVTRENVATLKEKLLRSKVDDEVILFASGHGLLDDSLDFYFATYDIDFRHPEMRGISFDDFENILDSIPARKKVFLMDACHSGEVDKDEMGGLTASNTVKTSSDIAFRGNVRAYTARAADPAAMSGVTLNNTLELMQELFTGLDKGTGTTVISAAAGKGYALESPQWNNGVFTYSIINGLKNHAADKNRDGTITISELKDYSIKEVQLLTDGQQKPTARRESINYDWKIW
jgi:WD40 repeat protein/ankyrin repeat protein